MPYTIEITTPAKEIDSEQVSSRMYQLPESFTTVAEAKDAASAHIKDTGLDPMTVLFSIFDREGFTVASNVDQPAGSD